jgi:hypothetical protein
MNIYTLQTPKGAPLIGIFCIEVCRRQTEQKIHKYNRLLEDALFRNKINDLSFEIAKKLVVILEHQATINPNMPLRLLSYIARLYAICPKNCLNMLHKN